MTAGSRSNTASEFLRPQRLLLPPSAQPGGRGSPEAAGGLREGQRRCEAHEHRQQAESGARSDTAQTTEGKGSSRNPKLLRADDVCVRACVRVTNVKHM